MSQSATGEAKVRQLLILDIIHINLFSPCRINKNPPSERLLNINGDPCSQKTSIVVKTDILSVLIHLLCYRSPPSFVPQVVGQIHNPSPNMQPIKLHLVGPHALIKFYEHHGILADMPWGSCPHAITISLRLKTSHKHVLPHRSELKPLWIPPRQTGCISNGVDMQQISVKNLPC